MDTIFDSDEQPIDIHEDELDVIGEFPITTTNKITKYELPVILSMRTTQIDRGSKVFIKNPERFTDSYSIALEEFKQNLIPFIIRRPINRGKGIYQNIKISDLTHELKYDKI
jgi:DNA-directed RNA polymerase subunit K/omega